MDHSESAEQIHEQTGQAASGPKKSNPLRVVWWCVIGGLVCLCIAGLISSMPGTDPALVKNVGSALIPLLIAGCVLTARSWYLRDVDVKDRIALTVTFACVLAGFGLWLVFAEWPRERAARAASNNIVEAASVAKRQALEEFNRTGRISDPKQFEEPLKALNEAKANATGTERITLDVGAELTSKLAKLTTSYVDEATKAHADGLYEVQTAKSAEDVQSRINRMTALRAMNAKIAVALRALPEDFEAGLRARGMNQHDIASTLRGFNSGAHVPEQLKIREFEDKMLEAAIDMASMLKEHFGHWTFASATGVKFDDDSKTAEFREIAKRLKGYRDEESAVVREILSKPVAK